MQRRKREASASLSISSHATKLQSTVPICPGSSRVIPLLSPQLLRRESIFGEQVASPDGLAWLDIISSDLEAAHYACGAVDTCAAGFGAPHIRQRLYWVADASFSSCWTRFCDCNEKKQRGHVITDNSATCGLGNTVGKGLEGYAGHGDGEAGWQKQDRSTSTAGSNGVPLPTDGFWQNADWLLCRDGKWRPVEPGSCPLAHGTTARVGRLRGYGNAIVAPQAAAFIAVFLLSLHKSTIRHSKACSPPLSPMLAWPPFGRPFLLPKEGTMTDRLTGKERVPCFPPKK